MAWTFNTISTIELELKDHIVEINVKFHWTDKLLNYNLILDRDILQELE